MDPLDALILAATPSCCSNETRLHLLGDPGISAAEREHRAAVLDAIDRKIAREGEYVARNDPNAAAQFLPYRSLKGWDELVHERADLVAEGQSAL